MKDREMVIPNQHDGFQGMHHSVWGTFHYDKDDVMGAMISIRLDTPNAGDCIMRYPVMIKAADYRLRKFAGRGR